MTPNRELAHLYPPFAVQVNNLLYRARAEGMQVHVFEGLRDFNRQLDLYAKGRRRTADGKWEVVDPAAIVTRAFPGFSLHCYGVAVDLVFDGNLQREGVQWTWEDADLTKPGRQALPWARLGQLGELCGLEWSGRWTKFPELPHFQNRFGLQVHQMYDLWQDGGLEAVWKAFDGAARRAA